ncbi:AAEL017351-PA [Aedes aegypti]|uniref:AAEL017351-PA n=1 Tax=Aedes aegypti TaxID=7159 RepID=J9EBV2_AEDAE|nr:AAEL017351-PA [Aedes aegypti]
MGIVNRKRRKKNVEKRCETSICNQENCNSFAFP